MLPRAPGDPGVAPAGPPAVGRPAVRGVVGVLPRVDVEGAAVGVGRANAGPADDVATVERGGVARPHRLVVVGAAQAVGPPEPVDAVERAQRQLTAVHRGEGAPDVVDGVGAGDDLATVAVAVVGPVVDPEQPQLRTADRTAPVPGAAGHLVPHPVRDRRDPRVGPLALGVGLVGQVDPRSRRRTGQPDRGAGREVVDPVDAAAVGRDPVEPGRLDPPAGVGAGGDLEGRPALGIGARASVLPPVLARESALEQHPAAHGVTVAGAPAQPELDGLLVDDLPRPAHGDHAGAALQRGVVAVGLRGGVRRVAVVAGPERVVGRVPVEALQHVGVARVVGDEHRHLRPAAVDAALEVDGRGHDG